MNLLPKVNANRKKMKLSIISARKHLNGRYGAVIQQA
jgi:hypothetical protein